MQEEVMTRGASALSALGFSEIEALAYCFLLKESPATAYRVSHGIGKPTANTYKAIASLAAQGAITLDDGESKEYRAVPPEELLARLESGFRGRKQAAADALKGLHQDDADDRVYRLVTVDQVFERARAMLARAEEIVLVDAFMGPLEGIEAAVKAAVKRKVKVVIQGYDDRTVPGAVMLRNNRTPEVISHWPGQHFTLVADAREHLLALFSQDLSAVHQAVWSHSAFLSCMHHNHLACDFTLTALETLAPEDPRRVLMAGLSLLQAEPLGLRELRDRLATGSGGAAGIR
jgi:sugar-specific transcriptional regulator TrmB